ncbi:hypothetical protein SUGI_1018440 [Cryptomeria japonica]|nr:hypothetical protein SUGI_1018440 [Cryptomeria japonica]
MARKEKITAFTLVLALALIMLSTDVGIGVQASKCPYPEGCIRNEPCPADTGAECEVYSIPTLPCSCSEVKRCDPTASGCSESTIAGLRSCDF